MKFRYVGDHESPKKTTVLGIEFPKGEAVDVDEEHTLNGKHAVTLLKGMPHFENVDDDVLEPTEKAPEAKKPAFAKKKA